MTKVIRLEPHSAALFFSIDSDPGFGIKLCNDATLRLAVHEVLYGNRAPDADTRPDVAETVELREDGDVVFEEGWLKLRLGMKAVTDLLMDMVVEIKLDEHFADKRRFEECKRREEAETKYALLRQALVDALGDKKPEIAARAVA
jgi:hypothetical protein